MSTDGVSFRDYQQQLCMRRVYGKGLNIAAQINSSRQNLAQWTPIQQLDDYQVTNMGCGYLQSYFFLSDGQLLKNGNFMDTLSSVRMLNFYRMFPRVFRAMQNMKFLGSLLSFRGGEEHLTLLNGKQLQSNVKFERAVFGQSGAHLFDVEGNMWVIGENYFGQRGTGDCLTNESSLRKVQGVFNAKQNEEEKQRQKISDIAVGFQHSILVTAAGEAYGCGKADSHQIQPYCYHHYQDVITLDKIQKPELLWGRRKVTKAACGFRHSLILTEDGKLFGMGLNNFGQCGKDYTKYMSLPRLTQIFFPYRSGEQIRDIQCGSYHTLIMTNLGVYFMGSVKQNQNPFLLYSEHVSSPTLLSLPGRPLRIFVNFDRSAVITDEGKAYIFGGKDMSGVGGQSGSLEVLDQWQFGEDSLVGLGFSHTLIRP